jgi:hypothetical protein
MPHVNALISERLKKSEPSSKMATLAEKSAGGGLTSFSGLFPTSELTPNEKKTLEEILSMHAKDQAMITADLKILVALTAEVKAINHQAALLHGERIKKAQELFANYKEGAFSAWLIATYGNRQTPYNLMQYYDFYQALPTPLRAKVTEMPRQAIYSLASRAGDIAAKHKLIAQYQGQTKNDLLYEIRALFPLPVQDKRRENIGNQAITLLEKAHTLLQRSRARLSKEQKEALKELLQLLSSTIKKE